MVLMVPSSYIWVRLPLILRRRSYFFIVLSLFIHRPCFEITDQSE